jgi:hypothetical protein
MELILFQTSLFHTWNPSMLALGNVLRKKEKIKEKEIKSMKCVEGTQTEEGSKWLKK